MAKAKVVPGDQHSLEFQELRKTVHTLLHLLEAVGTPADGAEAATALGVISAAIASGVTVDGRPLHGVIPKVRPKGLPVGEVILDLDVSDKNY